MAEHRLWHQSGVNPQGEPFVQLLKDGKIICQLTPTDARDHARAITEAAEAAEQDAFLVWFLGKKVGMELDGAVKILVEFRRFREARTQKAQGPTKAEDWVVPPAPEPEEGEA
jgi:hypothetical protein